jgi:hypothetical protein
MIRSVVISALSLAALAACEKEGSEDRMVIADDLEDNVEIEIVGVSPDDFQCESVAPIAAVSAALGSPVSPDEPHFEPPAGAPRPCNYVGPAPEFSRWSFDLDCRESAPETGDELMVIYATKPESTPVRVGRSGIDHRDAVLFFIDDDAPCWGRILGPGADRRLALGRLVSKNLKVSNAPREVIRRSSGQADE